MVWIGYIFISILVIAAIVYTTVIIGFACFYIWWDRCGCQKKFGEFPFTVTFCPPACKRLLCRCIKKKSKSQSDDDHDEPIHQNDETIELQVMNKEIEDGGNDLDLKIAIAASIKSYQENHGHIDNIREGEKCTF